MSLRPAAPVPTVVRPRRTTPLRAEEAADRGIVSRGDRSRPLVRFGLGAIHVAVLIGLVIAGLGPVIWLALASVSSTQDIVREPLTLLSDGRVLWENLTTAWVRGRIGEALGNSAALAVGSTLTTLFVSTTAAYVLSVLRPRWGGLLSGAILATLFVPGVISLVPLYLTIIELPVVEVRLINTFWAVWLPAGASAFNVVIIKRFFDSIPGELFEAARVDGAGALRTFLLIVLPLSRPILGVVALLSIVASWKDYLWPLLVLTDTDLQPVSVALPRLAEYSELNVQLAALFLALLVPVVLFLIFQRQFLRGIGTAGSVKG